MHSPWSTARWVTLVPAVLAALWFLMIGANAVLTGRHFGPLGEAYWAQALDDAGMGVRIVGAALMAWGLGWCALVRALLRQRAWRWRLGLALGLLSLWQEPVGTLLGLYLLGALAYFKHDLHGTSRRGAAPRRGVQGKALRRKAPRRQALRLR